MTVPRQVPKTHFQGQKYVYFKRQSVILLNMVSKIGHALLRKGGIVWMLEILGAPCPPAPVACMHILLVMRQCGSAAP